MKGFVPFIPNSRDDKKLKMLEPISSYYYSRYRWIILGRDIARSLYDTLATAITYGEVSINQCSDAIDFMDQILTIAAPDPGRFRRSDIDC